MVSGKCADQEKWKCKCMLTTIEDRNLGHRFASTSDSIDDVDPILSIVKQTPIPLTCESSIAAMLHLSGFQTQPELLLDTSCE